MPFRPVGEVKHKWKKWAKKWRGNWVKNHTNSERLFVMIEFTNSVEFMSLIE